MDSSSAVDSTCTVAHHDGYETSGQYIGALSRALATLHRLDAVVQRSSVELSRMLMFPTAQAWWPQPLALELTRVVVAVGGTSLLRDVARRAVFGPMWTVVEPLARVMMVLASPRPETLLARFPALCQAGVRNVAFSWRARSRRAGTMTLTFPSVVPPELVHYWEPTFELVFDATRYPGIVVSKHEGARLAFELSWSERA